MLCCTMVECSGLSDHQYGFLCHAGVTAGFLKPGDTETFCKLALKQPPLPRGRLDALIMDFAAISRGEGTSDALLAYDL